MEKKLKVEYKKISDLIPYVNNTRTHSDTQVLQIASSIKEFGFTNPILIDEEGRVIAGHGRIMGAKKLGLDEAPTITLKGLTEAQRKAYIIADNKLALNSGWDEELLKVELQALDEIDFDLSVIGFDEDELSSYLDDTELTEGLTDEDDVPEPPEKPITREGDIWLLGNHRLMCGDSTSVDTVEKLMDGKKAELVFTDPPYGMKKEAEGILNDNLNFDDLLLFNKEWIPVTFLNLKDNGSWYCWGIDEPLMDIYSEILKPMIKQQKATFRNLITWDKGHGQGQLSEDFRSYPNADEKCLFIMCGVQGFNNNSDNYFDKWEPIRSYFEKEIKSLDKSDREIANALGFKDGRTVNHWWAKSQWSFINSENYKKLQDYCNGEAFKKEYEEIKKEYYSTRAYFNNTHDNMNNVWHFPRTSQAEREGTGGHASPKPLALCERAIRSSSEKDNIVLDVFGGSGSTLLACETNSRQARLMELDPKYCDVIINRWQDFTGKQATLEVDGRTFEEVSND